MTPSKRLLDKVWGCQSCYAKSTCPKYRAGKRDACGSIMHVQYKPQGTSQHKS